MVYGWDRGVVIMQEPVLRNLTLKSFSSRNLRIRLHRRLSQALHLHDNKTGNLGINVNGYGRHTVLDFDPGADFHTYGVQVDPDPVSPDKHAIISYLLDGKVTNTFKTIDYDDRYNTFITKAIAEGREKRTWDIAITGQIGGKNEMVSAIPKTGMPI